MYNKNMMMILVYRNSFTSFAVILQSPMAPYIIFYNELHFSVTRMSGINIHLLEILNDTVL